MNLQTLSKIANNLVAPKKGILAADESSGTISLFFFSKPGISDDAHENNKIGNNKIKKPLNILNKRYFIKKFNYYNFLN